MLKVEKDGIERFVKLPPEITNTEFEVIPLDFENLEKLFSILKGGNF